MKIVKLTVMLLCSMMAFNGCTQDDGQIVYEKKKAAPEEQQQQEEKKEEEGQNTPTGNPVMGSYKTLSVSVPELSGLCFGADSSFLWAVGDEGVVSKITPEGKVTKVWTHDADMEDVTVDPATGNLLIAIEGAQKLYQLDAPNYNTYKTTFYVQDAVDGDYGNGGLEGISYYKDGIVFIGAQTSAMLWKYKLDGTKVSRISLRNISSKIKEVGGLCYDKLRDQLWVTDSEAAKLFVLDGDVTKLIATYDVSFISNAESVCVDHVRSCVWVGSDESSPKLYKISFTNL